LAKSSGERQIIPSFSCDFLALLLWRNLKISELYGCGKRMPVKSVVRCELFNVASLLAVLAKIKKPWRLSGAFVKMIFLNEN